MSKASDVLDTMEVRKGPPKIQQSKAEVIMDNVYRVLGKAIKDLEAAGFPKDAGKLKTAQKNLPQPKK